MKAIIAVLLLFSLLPVVVSAIYGGDSISYVINDCHKLMVNITNAELNEWKVSPNCTEETAGNFNCNCSGNWTLNLTPATNSEGSFAISIINYDSIETTTQTVFVSSTGGGSSFVFGTTTATTQPTPTSTVATTQTLLSPTSTSTPITTTPAGANPFSAVTGFLFLPSTQYSVVFILLALMVSIILYKFVFKSSKTGENNPSQNNPSESSNETNGPAGI